MVLNPNKTLSISILIISFLVFLLAAEVKAQAKGPEDVIEQLFDGMRAGDGSAIRSIVAEGASLDRVTASGELRTGGFERWISWVDQQKEGDADEQIFAVKVQEFDNLATVWAPFILHYKKELVGCGVNQFTLAKVEGVWKIVHGIDTAHNGDCSEFRSLARFK
ncbi:nuclear transport factor 2 family protein [Kordiimonas sp. SCSIO 12610]|uniref:nuclear transport factor 2 family protein n=1 Tax=Kordiimonas sp. SCSIO 12610 TaxID=2829597 RepID=UPI002109ED06|nr:nuclear transport factor 2 family protein [Kordiimonas sp. SCSIO 12610]UTW54582.1 nuclear transport factor 2 family protein [Kordiimonas sp. SCSIO 12610]